MKRCTGRKNERMIVKNPRLGRILHTTFTISKYTIVLERILALLSGTKVVEEYIYLIVCDHQNGKNKYILDCEKCMCVCMCGLSSHPVLLFSLSLGLFTSPTHPQHNRVK